MKAPAAHASLRTLPKVGYVPHRISIITIKTIFIIREHESTQFPSIRSGRVICIALILLILVGSEFTGVLVVSKLILEKSTSRGERRLI